MAGSATRGPGTDLELWLKGHFSRVDTGGHEDRMWDFGAYKMVSLTTRLLCCCCAQGNEKRGKIQSYLHQNKLLFIWKKLCIFIFSHFLVPLGTNNKEQFLSLVFCLFFLIMSIYRKVEIHIYSNSAFSIICIHFSLLKWNKGIILSLHLFLCNASKWRNKTLSIFKRLIDKIKYFLHTLVVRGVNDLMIRGRWPMSSTVLVLKVNL